MNARAGFLESSNARVRAPRMSPRKSDTKSCSASWLAFCVTCAFAMAAFALQAGPLLVALGLVEVQVVIQGIEVLPQLELDAQVLQRDLTLAIGGADQPSLEIHL